MTTCSQGHQSEWADYCSVCGESLGGAAPGAAPAAGSVAAAAAAPTGSQTGAPQLGSNNCSNCAAVHGPDDVFCESCGFDFTSGTLPDAEAVPDATPAVAAATPTVAVLTVDANWAAQAIGETELQLPADAGTETEVPLRGTKALVGRGSKSRGIFPEIDVDAITGDPAVSSRHAMIERDDSGNWTITDVGSTNGTVIDDPEGEPVAAGTAIALTLGQPVFFGAWTRLELRAESK